MRIAIVGDVMLGRWVNKLLRDRSAEDPWGDCLDLLNKADWRICNLECALADTGHPWTETPKVFHFRSDAKNVAVLQAAGIHVVSLANNHALDYGYEALSETQQNLARAGIAQAGAGENAEEAQQPALMIVDGLQVGLIAFTDNQPEWEAKEETAGVFYAPVERPDERTQRLLDSVAAAKAKADLLVVSAHWGPNWGYAPRKGEVRLAHELIEHGADIVFGHSPHICRGIEIYRNRPILYSTGDFIDDYAVDPKERNDQSFVFHVVVLDRTIVAVELFPTLIKDCRAMRARGAEKQPIMQHMTDLCQNLDTQVAWCGDAEFLRIDCIGASSATGRLLD